MKLSLLVISSQQCFKYINNVGINTQNTTEAEENVYDWMNSHIFTEDGGNTRYGIPQGELLRRQDSIHRSH